MAGQEDTRTIRQLAAEAMAIQNACNLCGLSQAFGRAMSRLLTLESSTAKVNTHVITRVWLDKLCSLSGVHFGSDGWALDAYRDVEHLAADLSAAPAAVPAASELVDAEADTQREAAAAAAVLEDGPCPECHQLDAHEGICAGPAPRPHSLMTFDQALTLWLAAGQKRIDEEHARSGSVFAARKLSLDPGGVRYVRVVATDGPSRSALAFVECATGNVYKPDGWKRPAKGVRGNIYGDTRGVASAGELYARR